MLSQFKIKRQYSKKLIMVKVIIFNKIKYHLILLKKRKIIFKQKGKIVIRMQAIAMF